MPRFTAVVTDVHAGWRSRVIGRQMERNLRQLGY